ncbi:MAG: UDP-2,3-diacylglucosamine diphosphatase LpxI [Candidatus Omnitrophica bacterium]|nr:UDP-2,3-diacylglucosamine diphosphatase LpxI [Candidatus Omnitrophota bacterium]
MKIMGMIAGNGRFPLIAAREALHEGYRVVVCAIEGEADPQLKKLVDAWIWVKIGQLKKLVKFFRAEGVREAMMVGKIEKVRLFQENVSPDLEMIKVLMKTKNFKDDSLLLGIADYLFEEGIGLVDSTMFVKDLCPREGVMGKRKPSRDILEDIQFGFDIAKSIAGLDIGQTVVVKKKAVMAVEAIEGTDLAIKRGGRLGKDKVVVVKVAKPNQDMRFDVPAVGLKTLDELISVKAAAFAFEAEKTIFFDRDEFVKQANKHGIAIVGVKKAEKL